MNGRQDVRPRRTRKIRAGTLMKLIGQGESDVRRGKVVGQKKLFSRLKSRLAKTGIDKTRPRVYT